MSRVYVLLTAATIVMLESCASLPPGGYDEAKPLGQCEFSEPVKTKGKWLVPINRTPVDTHHASGRFGIRMTAYLHTEGQTVLKTFYANPDDDSVVIEADAKITDVEVRKCEAFEPLHVASVSEHVLRAAPEEFLTAVRPMRSFYSVQSNARWILDHIITWRITLRHVNRQPGAHLRV